MICKKKLIKLKNEIELDLQKFERNVKNKDIPNFYTCILGSSGLYMSIPVFCYAFYNEHTLSYNILCTNCLSCLFATLYFWNIYDFTHISYYCDFFLASSLGVNLLINNIYSSHIANSHTVFFLNTPLILYWLGLYTKYFKSYMLTMYIHIIFRYILFLNIMMLLDTQKTVDLYYCTVIYYSNCIILSILHYYIPDMNYLESIVMCKIYIFISLCFLLKKA